MSTQQHADNLCNLIIDNMDYPSQPAWYAICAEAEAICVAMPKRPYAKKALDDINMHVDIPGTQETWYDIQDNFLNLVADAAIVEGYLEHICDTFPDFFQLP